MCKFSTRSAGLIGFDGMDRVQASEAARELGATHFALQMVTNRYYSTHRTSLISIAFFDINEEEIFYWSNCVESGTVFDPPRPWGDIAKTGMPLIKLLGDRHA